MILFLFTSSYPYDYAAEYTFIQPEIQHLLEKFEKVILMPRISKGKKLPLPSGVEVNDEYADFLQRGSQPRQIMRNAFSTPHLAQEIRQRPTVLFYPSKMLKLILFSGRAELTNRWTTEFIRKQHLDPDDCIFYSYWFDHTATGLTMIKQEFPRTKVVSRAHGYDIYEEYYYPYYWPYRRMTLKMLDVLFSASEAGRNYFCERYPEYQMKFETAHLGIEDPGFINNPSSDGIFRIISCAHIVPVKRLDLLLDGIATAAQWRPEQKIEWTHFGGGVGIKSLNKRIARSFPPNAQGQFLGNVPNHEILQYYKDHPVDVFVNVSNTEGGAPVSIQEAISCGIPIIATAVGGNPEIVSERNGFLLNADPTPQAIAQAFLEFIDHPELVPGKRQGSRAVWMERYNAEVNFRLFAERLKSIGET